MKKTKRVPVSIYAYNKIKTAILNNELMPGEKLVEASLAETLNMSRTPIREALRQLEQEGFVTYYPQKGSIVSHISTTLAQELYEVREVLEGLAVRLICERADDIELVILKNIVDEMGEVISNKDYSTHVSLQKKWTENIILLAKNKILQDKLTSLNEHLARLRKISLANPDQNLEAYDEIVLTLSAIMDRDPMRAEKLARQHVINAKKRYYQYINLL
ncbi:MAG: GntR family transcriptional regulator [Tepidanaerobacteraceae bacterium]|jgi:DNA-binding GntR family transcriptional regulator|nr:GntR family transcriptional regulator [Tepidanaerobacter sp.]HQA60037.1 GntR family transcriptional regulator [Tepidanaerobacteraceae bacterium]HQE06486.1 GntR family transcriptional regulator [Tepidanaerobacteraceae bacterium]